MIHFLIVVTICNSTGRGNGIGKARPQNTARPWKCGPRRRQYDELVNLVTTSVVGFGNGIQNLKMSLLPNTGICN